MYTATNQYIVDSVTPSDELILDVGCGTGGTASEIKSRFPDCDITGLNHDAGELEIASQFMTESMQVDLNNFPPESLDKQYDLIICSHVLEHLIDPKRLLSILSHHLKPTGRIIVLVPNFGMWNARLKVFRGRFEYEESGLFDRTHLRFFTYFTLADELLGNEFLLAETLAHGHFPLPIIRKLIPSSVLDKIDAWSLRVFPNLFSSEIGLILSKR